MSNVAPVEKHAAKHAAHGTAELLSSHRLDDLEAMGSDITILAVGRVVFSGPLGKLADPNGELDYRLVTSDIEAARQVAADTGGIQVLDTAGGQPDREVLVVRTLVSDLDELVPRLLHAGIALRELTPVVSPLESAFLALTEQHAQESS
jgi:ABC-2 type transport system ATP-binding protein